MINPLRNMLNCEVMLILDEVTIPLVLDNHSVTKSEYKILHI